LRLFWALLLPGACLAADTGNPAEFFELRVRPVLAKNCYGCHTGTRSGGLRLDAREHLMKGGNSGPALVPGDADRSLLFQAAGQTHERLKMPPGGRLSVEDVAALKTWIDAGAIWPDSPPPAAKSAYVISPEQRAFWAFQPVRKPAPPPVRHTAWAKTAIDRFILAKLEARGLRPAAPADRRTLIRRATFDLTGLPPTPEEIDDFARDRSPEAFARVVDRLLASPRYGERWGRYWLDVARYSDDRLNSTMEDPYPNPFRYRDWVIQAFNNDMPYDRFVKAQIAGDLLEPKEHAALGFYALSPEFQDDRVDATTRGFLGLTVACAQCHDHKYDPIPTQDYYSLLGIFNNTEPAEYPLAPEAEVAAWRGHKEKLDQREKALGEYIERQAGQLAGILAEKTGRFLLAARKLEPADGLDAETLRRWTQYLARPAHEHPFLKDWQALAARNSGAEEFRKAASVFQETVLAIHAEKEIVDEKNRITLGLNPSRRDLSGASLASLERDRYMLYRDLFERRGVLYHGADEIECYLAGEFRDHLLRLRSEVAALRRSLPPQYPFIQGIRDKSKLQVQRVYLRGNRESPGEPAPPRFLAILSEGERKTFTGGSARLELAEAIADPRNPLTARVIVNRAWHHHFGQGLVRTLGNFGQLGDRPSHPELLDYLASRFLERGWSLKALHREIMMSAAYGLSAAYSERSFAADPENRLLWRANRRRLDVEAMRDSLLYVSGALDLAPGGAAARLSDENRRRTIYGFVSRKKLDTLLALFDFPNPNSTGGERLATNVPTQRLFFMNSGLAAEAARGLAARLEGSDTERIRQAYRLLFGRAPHARELALGREFLRSGPWPHYAQALLASNEFTFID
jgi:hypothetical protein